MVRFAFDLGTNSIGWAVLEADQDDTIVTILDMGVRVFSDGREPSRSGVPGDPLNQTRRQKRAQRRILERRKRRKRAMYHFLKSCGYLPENENELNAWRTMDPYYLRAAALERSLSALELSRVMMQLAARRGFKSNRKTDVNSKETSEFNEKINAMAQRLHGKTLGQYLYEMKRQDPRARIRFRPGIELYPSRPMYEDEFRKIQERQHQSHPDFDWGRAYRIIFFQRPLKRPERGYCTFYTSEPRAYIAQPSFQRFRLLQDINALKYFTNAEYELTPDQKRILYRNLEEKKELTFSRIRELLHLPSSAAFKFEKGSKEKLQGLETDQQFSKILGEQWKKLELSEKDRLVEYFILEEDEEKIHDLFAEYGFESERIHSLIEKADLRTGVASLSVKFMRECAEIMEKEWLRYNEAVSKMGLKQHAPWHHDTKLEKLPYYGTILSYTTVKPSSRKNALVNVPTGTGLEELEYGKIANPSVHIVLNQLRKLCNVLIDKFEKPDRIHLETETELKNGRERLKKIIQEQRKNRETNIRIEKCIRDILRLPESTQISRSDIQKFRLWEELGTNDASRCCVYCGKPISAHQLFNGDAELEHILPFSRTLQNSRNNLTIAHKGCNAIKGNRTPFEAFGNNPKGYNWEEIEARVSEIFRGNYAKKANFLKKNLEADISESSSFLDSQLSDTAFMSRAAREYLSCLIPESAIITSPGRLTALLRAKWGLDGILSREGVGKNRSDHRHHAIDALVIGLSSRAILKRFATANARNYSGMIDPPPLPVKRDEIITYLKQMLISHKPDHGLGGPIFDETAYGFDRQTLEAGKMPTEYIVRKPVNMLSEKMIEDILSESIKKRIKTFITERGLDSSKPDEKALQKALEEFGKANGIHAVRIKAKNAEGFACLMPGRNGRTGHKAYQKTDVLCVDIWKIPGKNGKKPTFEGDFKKRADVLASGGCIQKDKPHPAAKWLMRLYKNDVIMIVYDKGTVFARIAGYDTVHNRLDLQPLYACDTISNWINGTADGFLDPFWKIQKSSHNYIAINSLFSSAKRVRHVNITIDGKLLCRKE